MKNKLPLICITLLFVTGCTSLDRLKKLNIDASKGFNQAIAKNYLEFSDSEAKAYDWSTSGYFARKGLRAMKGEVVLPEELDNWDIPKEEVDNLKWARNRLMNVLTDKMRNDFPEKAAKAQFLYDCWVEQQEENWQTEDINACRAEFLLEVAELEYKLAPEVLGEVTMDGSEVPALIEPVSKQVIYFSSGSSALKDADKKSIEEIVAKSKEMQSFMIKVGGHADTVGSDKINMELSKSRANSVADRFVENGISPTSIERTAYGETMPAIKTKNNIAEQLNRRVEVDISGSK
jgi:OOP family OmpA-OmpF porin